MGLEWIPWIGRTWKTRRLVDVYVSARHKGAALSKLRVIRNQIKRDLCLEDNAPLLLILSSDIDSYAIRLRASI